MDIEIVVEGVSDTTVSSQITRALHQVCRHRLPHGPSLRVLTTEIDQLPALVGDQLKACF